MESDGIAYSSSTPVVMGQAIVEEQPYNVSGCDGKVVEANAVIVQGKPIFHGFELWIPPQPNTFNDGLPVYTIQGTDAQIVMFPLRSGRKIMCFSGAMCYMSDGMKLDLQLAGFGGGSLFQLTYTNETSNDGYVAMTPDYPGVIVPINMATCPNGKIIALRDSFLCSTFALGDITTDVGAGFNPAQSVAGFCCSGIDFIVQTITQGDWIFLMAMGTVIQKVCVVTSRVVCNRLKPYYFAFCLYVTESRTWGNDLSG
jgi:uncharacterized protein (AIM24 family)